MVFNPFGQYKPQHSESYQPQHLGTPLGETPGFTPGHMGSPTLGARIQKLNPKQFLQNQATPTSLANRALNAQQTARVFQGSGGMGRALRYTLSGHVVGEQAQHLYTEEMAQRMSQMHGGVEVGGE